MINIHGIFTDRTVHNLCFGDITNNKEFYNNIVKNAYYCKKVSDLYNIALSSFSILNVPEQLSENHLKRLLIDNGTLAITDKSNIGLISCTYTTDSVNQNNEPARITLVPTDKTITIDKNLTSDNFAIVNLSPTKNGLIDFIQNTALYETIANQVIFNNMIGLSLQYILQGTAEQKQSFEEILDKIFNLYGFVGVDVAKGDRNFLKAQVNELNYIGDKMIELKKHFNNEFLYSLGINHVDYEKKERLITSEVTTHDAVIDLIRNGYIDTINTGLADCNNKFGTDMIATSTIAITSNKGGDNIDIKE